MLKRTLALGALLLMISGCAPRTAPAGRAAAAPVGTVTLSIVGTNDLHGGIVARDGRGGLALLGGYLKNLRAARAADGGAVLVIDAGDMFQGTLESNLTEGASVVSAYNALGYAAAAVGNHEFDFGPVGASATPRTPADDPRGALKARAAEARFPFLAANLVETATGATPPWTRPALVVDAAGVKVGIIGLMTRSALTATISSNVRDLSVTPLAEAILKHAPALRAQGAAVVIVTAHAGGRCSSFERPEDLSSCDAGAEIFSVARALPAGLVDVIVGGHSHAPVAHRVAGVPIIESFSGGRAFGRVDLTVDRQANAVTGSRIFPPRDLCAREDPTTRRCDTAAAAGPMVQATYENAPVVPDAAIDTVLAPVLEQVRALKAQPIGITLGTPIRRQIPVSPLGNLFTDALLAAVPGADVAINNSSGGLRADLPAGPLTFGSVYEVMPFDNLVVELKLTGQQLRRVFAAYVQSARRVVGFSGVTVRAQCTAGALDLAMVRPSGAQIRDEETVRVVVSDFLATGGDGILAPIMPEGGFAVDHSAPLLRDAFASYLKTLKGPLREADYLDTGHPRLVIQGEQPLKCQG